MILPTSIAEYDALLYCRGLQPNDYRPTMFDVQAAAFRLFDTPTTIVKQLKI